MALTNRQKFCMQRYHAKLRNIEWDLSFEDWMSWWGDDLEKRGCKNSNDLVMARKGDVGPYSLDNIVKMTVSENSKDCRSRNKFKGRPVGSYSHSLETRLKIGQSNTKIKETI